MNGMRAAFEWLVERYELVFADWLHINFAVRTVILLLLVWAAVYLASQLVRYLIGPLFVLFWYHVVFRAWNFIFIETPMEWIYIHYFSNEKLFLSETYLKLCDKINYNRMRLEHTRLKGILLKGGTVRTARVLMITGLVCCTFWVVAFGLYQRYGRDAFVEEAARVEAETPAASKPPITEPTQVPVFSPEPPEPEPTVNPEDLFFYNASYFILNEYGADGANVRDNPFVEDSTVVEVVYGDAVVSYLGEYVRDEADASLFWLKIETGYGTVGYISSKLVSAVN